MADVTFSDTLRHWNMLAVAVCNRFEFATRDSETGEPVPRAILQDIGSGTPVLYTGDGLPSGAQLDSSRPTADAEAFVRTITREEFWRAQVKSFYEYEKRKIADVEAANEAREY